MIHSIDVPPDYMSTKRHFILPEIATAASLFERAKSKYHSDSIDGSPLSPTEKHGPRPPRSAQFLWSDLFARRVVGKMQAERDKLLRSEQAMLGGAAYAQDNQRRHLSVQRSEAFDAFGDDALRYVSPTQAHKSSTTSSQSSTSVGDRPLTIVWIDQFIQANTLDHKTNDYAYSRSAVKPKLVVRRGQQFKVEIAFSRRTDYENDTVTLLWTQGVDANVAAGSRIKVDLPLKENSTEEKIVSEWKFKLLETRFDGFIVGVTTATSASIGLWSCNVITQHLMTGEPNLEHECSMIDLFLVANPANEGDSLHLPSTVANLSDVLYSEYARVIQRVRSTYAHWALGQYELGVLDAVLTILVRFQKADQTEKEIAIVETLAYAICTHILPTESQFDYTNSEAISENTGSASILLDCAKYDTSLPCRSLWQRVTVLETALRALGIPCRPVTAVNFGQNANANFIDYYFEASTGKLTQEKGSSTLWPSRVWLEAWLNDGTEAQWHAIDLSSNDVRLITATPVKAIKERAYRQSRLFNDSLTTSLRLWQVDREDNESLISTVNNNCQIMTLCGRQNLIDLTGAYVIKKMQTNKAEKKNKSWSVSIENDAIQYPYGESVKLRIKCENQSQIAKVIQVSVRVHRASQDGQAQDKICSFVRSIPLKPKTALILKECVLARDYCQVMDSNSSLLVSVFATSQDDVSNDVKVDADLTYLSLVEPKIDIQLSERPCVNDPLTVKLCIINHLPLTIHNCRFHIEGAGLTDPLELPAADTPSRGLSQVSFHCTPSMGGDRTFVVAFTSKELNCVRSALSVNVKTA